MIVSCDVSPSIYGQIQTDDAEEAAEVTKMPLVIVDQNSRSRDDDSNSSDEEEESSSSSQQLQATTSNLDTSAAAAATPGRRCAQGSCRSLPPIPTFVAFCAIQLEIAEDANDVDIYFNRGKSLDDVFNSVRLDLPSWSEPQVGIIIM